MFERLFKFSKINFAEGELGLQGGAALYEIGLLLLVLAGAFGAIYLLSKLYRSGTHRFFSLGLRLLVLLLLCLPLLEPVLMMPDVVPEDNFVAVMVDGSESMTLADGRQGATRGGDAQAILFDGGLLAALDETFKLRHYTFGSRAARTDSLQSVRYDQGGTDLTAALDRVISDFQGLPLAGVVLLTDGGDNSGGVPLNKAEELRDLGIPLHVVGLGRETFRREREILDVQVNQEVEQSTGAEVSVKVRSWAEEPEPVRFALRRSEEVVYTQQQKLKGGGRVDQFTFFYEPEGNETHSYVLHMEEASGELNAANNTFPAVIEAQQDTFRVLYFEGQLRPDFKFIKRALENDSAIEFASISRTGTGKFFRQGIDSPEELEGGFPVSEAALNAYHAVFFGDIEASFFTLEQLQLIERFVRVRGGGFMMLGGRNTFAEGSYEGTPIADLLPAYIDPSRETAVPRNFVSADSSEKGFRFVPTEVGWESSILKLSTNPDSNRTRWDGMPRLRSLNLMGAVKPGAQVLATKPKDAFGPSEPLLAVQRYGAGRAAALPTASTWRWQIQLPAEDERHERFWRQLVRWLVASAQGPVTVEGPDRLAAGTETSLRVQVYSPTYEPLSGAAVQGRMTAPDGEVQEIAFQEELTNQGAYSAVFTPRSEGLYRLEVTGREAGAVVGQSEQPLLVRASDREFQDAPLKKTLLEGLAEASSGKYYAPGEAETIPENIENRRSSTSVYRTSYLWDMPLLFGLILLLLSIEWVYRRRQGLP